MTTKQRLHYVLAKDAGSAKPIIEEFRKNGITNGVHWLNSLVELMGRNPKELAFIFADNFSEHPLFMKIHESVQNRILRGAIVKPVPKRPEIKVATKTEIKNASSIAEPTGGLWDAMNVAAAKAASASANPVYRDLFLGGPYDGSMIPPVVSNAAGEFFINDEKASHRYILWFPVVLGMSIRVWIHSDEWTDRQKLVRNHFLKALVA
jgi:hypothetical protein